MTASILCVGLAGTLPTDFAHRELAARGSVSGPAGAAPPTSPLLRRERKVRIIIEAAHRALEAIREQPEVLRRCGFVLATRWDGRPANLIDTETGSVRSLGALPPSTVALSLVPHVAASCVASLYGIQGRALSLASHQGLAAAWRIAERWLARGPGPVLIMESDLAMPSEAGGEIADDYALAVLLTHPHHSHDPGCDVDTEHPHVSIG